MANHFPFAAESVHAPVTDAEFRTYVLLCALAWQHHPEADPPYVELTYAELAAKHPKPVAVPTLRVRVMTLVKLGYLRREQVNRATWRTYVTGLAPLPPSGGGSTKTFSPKTPDKADQPRPIIVQRNRGGEETKPSADSRQGDHRAITLDTGEGVRPVITLDAGEPDRPMITLDTAPKGDRPMITLDAEEGDRPVITLGAGESDHPVITLDASEGDRPVITLGAGEGDRPVITLDAAPKGDRPVITLDAHKGDHPMITLDAGEGDHPTITHEPDRPTITHKAAEGDRQVITLVEPDRPVITLDAAEGDRPTITHEPDRSVITLNASQGDRPVITLEGNLAEGDRGLITQTAEGDRPAITLAPSRAHAYARVRAHADQDQDQITDLTDPDLIKLDLKNKKSDQSDQTSKDLDRERGAKPEADPAFSAWARTQNVVPDADADFGLSTRTGMGDEALAGADLPDSDPDFCFSSRTGVEDEILAGADLPDSDPDFGSSSRTGVGEGTSLPDSHAQAPSRQPSADRSGLTVPQAATSGKSNPGRQPSKNPPLTAPQAIVSGQTSSTRQPSKPSSLKASPPPTLDSILASLDESHRALAHDLLSLKPEPMDLKGMAEVMAKPVLTAAWYAWATDPANGVRKPAAYLRSMVRKGYFPPPRPGDEPDQPVSTVDADGVDRSNPNYDVWPGGFTVGKGEIFDPTTYVHPSRRNDLVWP